MSKRKEDKNYYFNCSDLVHPGITILRIACAWAQEHYPDVNNQSGPDADYSTGAAVHDRGSIVRMAGLKDQQRRNYFCLPAL